MKDDVAHLRKQRNTAARIAYKLAEACRAALSEHGAWSDSTDAELVAYPFAASDKKLTSALAAYEKEILRLGEP